MANNNYLSIYAKSFNWAGFFLPKKTYRECSILYDFCRTIDNIADEDGGLDIKKTNLLNFKNSFINKNYENFPFHYLFLQFGRYTKVLIINIIL
jgi:phytoene synthase